MEILLISEYFPPKIFGGGEISAGLLAKNLAERGLDVSVLTSHFSGLKKYEEKDKVKIYRRLRTGENPNSFIQNLIRRIIFPLSEKKELKKLEKEGKFDVIHFLNTTSIIDYKTDAKKVATINSYGNFCPKGNLFYKEREVCSGCNFGKYLGCIINSEYSAKLKLNFYLRYNPIFWLVSYLNYKQRNKALRDVDEFIVVSDFIKDFLINSIFHMNVAERQSRSDICRRGRASPSQIEAPKFGEFRIKEGIKEEKIHKIPSLVDIQEGGEEYKIEKKEGEMFITYIGNLEKIKGVSLLIKAFNEIENSDAKLLIVGEGSERKKLEKISDERIEFLGKVDYKFMPSIYKQSDIIVLPSLWPEPLSRVLLEALYFGKPIIATNVGGNSECVIDGKNGFLVKPEINEMKDKLKILINDFKLREKMSEESTSLYKEKFRAETFVSEIIRVY